jgi:hypothetical protein
MQRTLLALALVATATVTATASFAQTREPTDPYGRPLMGRNDWVRQPGDRMGPTTGGSPMGPEMATAPSAPMPPQAMRNAPLPAQSGPHQAAMKDEYGFRYDAQGNRLDARGNIISPHTR